MYTVVKVFLRRDLKRHLDNECPNREYECEYCGEKGTHVYITRVHDKTCAQKILPCPIPGCPEAITRQNLKKHISDDCPYTWFLANIRDSDVMRRWLGRTW